MEMQQVRYFLAVAKTLNFSRAAEQCNVTQPALTRAIRQLEEELGGELIRREGRLSHLTDLAMRMLPLLTQCYESARTAKLLAEKVRKGEVASLAIGVSRTLDIGLLVSVLGAVQKGFPSLQFKLKRGNGREIGEWLKTGEIELAFGGMLGEDWDRLDSWPMFTEGFHLVVASDSELAALEEIELDASSISGERLLFQAGCDSAEAARNCLKAAGIAVDNAHEVNSGPDLEALVTASLGVAVLPASSLRTPAVKHLRLNGLELMRTVLVYSIAGRSRSREASALLMLVRSHDWAEQLKAA